MKTEKCFVLDGAKSKEDLLEISFGKPDEEKVLLEQRHNIVSKICVLETVQYTWLSWIFTQYMIYGSCIFLPFFTFRLLINKLKVIVAHKVIYFPL